MQRVKAGFLTLAVVILLTAGMFAFVQPSAAQSGLTNFTNVKIAGDLTVGDDALINDDLTTDDLYLDKQTAQTISAGGTITPTGAYHQITSAAANGTSSIAGVSTAGRVLVLVNVGSNTITLTDTGTLKLSGNAALGQFDNITLISDGTNWVQLAKTDN